MGRGLGALAQVLGLGLLVAMLAPVVALGPAMVIDRGWDGTVRVSAFPPALVVLDPLVWRCVRNSVAVALIVTIGSLVLGIGLGVILGRRRYWGRWVLGGLAILPVAVSPIWVTPGVVQWIGGEAGWSWLAARSILGQPADEWARWFALIWVELAGATPLVIVATRRGLIRIDTAWADAARVVGAGRLRVWLDITWPTLRPELARVGGIIFAWTLIEPAGPILLDLRRTLVSAMADAALRFDEPNRAATLAVLAVALTVVVRSLLRRWGGPEVLRSTRPITWPVVPRASTRLGASAVVVLLLWVGLTLGPVVTVARRLGIAALGASSWSGAALRHWLVGFLSPELVSWTLNSGGVATLAIGLDLVLLRTLGRSGGRWWVRPWAAIPPLALAVGALALPSLLAAWEASSGQPLLVAALATLRVELSPGRSPGFLLILVMAAVYLGPLAGAMSRANPDGASDSTAAALVAGASTRQARQLARGRQPGTAVGPIVAVWTWAATDLAAAWLLTTLPERRTLAPAALALVGTGAEPLDPRLLGLFVATTLMRTVGLAWLMSSNRTSQQSVPAASR